MHSYSGIVEISFNGCSWNKTQDFSRQMSFSEINPDFHKI